jgi:hypothetical protein
MVKTRARQIDARELDGLEHHTVGVLIDEPTACHLNLREGAVVTKRLDLDGV